MKRVPGHAGAGDEGRGSDAGTQGGGRDEEEREGKGMSWAERRALMVVPSGGDDKDD